MTRRTGVMALIALAAVSHQAIAQTTEHRPQFDAASVKMADHGAIHGPAQASTREDSGRIDYQLMTIRQLILRAYQLEPYQIIWPKWIADLGQRSDVDRYTIVATMPPDTTKSQMLLMLQGLLTERFRLATHHETKPMPAYAVVASKGGARIRKVADPPNDVYMRPMVSAAGWHVSGDYEVSRLIGFFLYELDRPLLDMTGLKGYYHVDLFWDRPVQMGRGPGAQTPENGPAAPAAITPEGGNEASLFSAFEKQLGLTVEKRIIPTDMLVIDRVEHIPTGN